MSRLKLVLPFAFAVLLATTLLWHGNLAQQPVSAAMAITNRKQTLTPSEDAIAYLKANGYPDAIIELMNEEWRERSYRLQAKFIGAESLLDDERNYITNFMPKSLQGRLFEEILFAEEWNRPRTEKEEPIMRIHYFWQWKSQPFWTLNDWICVTSPNDSLMNPIALYWPANKEHQGPVEQLTFDSSRNGFLFRLKLKKIWRENGVLHKVDQHFGHISFNCLPRTKSDPQITLNTIYHHQRLPALFSPQLRTDGTHYAQWWAPSFFTNSDWTVWKLYLRD